MGKKRLIKKWLGIEEAGNDAKRGKNAERAYIDIPSMMFAGFAFGFLFDGIFSGTIGTLGEAFNGYKEWWHSLVASLEVIAIGVGICGIGFLYWWLVPRRVGVLNPALTGFGCLFAFLSFLSAIVIGTLFYSSATLN